MKLHTLNHVNTITSESFSFSITSDGLEAITAGELQGTAQTTLVVIGDNQTRHQVTE